MIYKYLDNLEALKIELSSIRRGGRAGHERPHKLIMLLDLFEDDLLGDNRIYLDDNLISRFKQHFSRYKAKDDLCQPAPPFFHLRSSSFWHHKILPGKEEEYKKTSTTGGGRKRIDELIEYSYLSEQMYQIMINQALRHELRQYLQLLLEQPEIRQ
ncbi:MAG: hypothetical protein C4331_12995 [Meiothermus sp.]